MPLKTPKLAKTPKKSNIQNITQFSPIQCLFILEY